jgi:hypothetical protein
MTSADQLEQGIHNALAAHDVKAAVEILEALATVDFRRAERIYKLMQASLTIAEECGEVAS